MSISNTSCDVLLTQLFPIFNESGYAFDDFRPIPHGVGFARLWISIREQTFPIIILTPYEYTIIRAPVRRCAQKLELHGGETIIPYIESELLRFGMSHQTVPPFNMYSLMKALKSGTSSI